MSRKFFIGLGLLLESVLLSTAWVLYHFSVRRMGMARHLVYLNGIWEKALPITALKTAAVIFALGFFLAILFLYLKSRRPVLRAPRIMTAVSVFSTGLFLTFALVFNARDLRAYYPILLIFFMALMLWHLLTLILLRSGKGGSTLQVGGDRP